LTTPKLKLAGTLMLMHCVINTKPEPSMYIAPKLIDGTPFPAYALHKRSNKATDALWAEAVQARRPLVYVLPSGAVTWSCLPAGLPPGAVAPHEPAFFEEAAAQGLLPPRTVRNLHSDNALDLWHGSYRAKGRAHGLALARLVAEYLHRAMQHPPPRTGVVGVHGHTQTQTG
jgi:hypothetical protein